MFVCQNHPIIRNYKTCPSSNLLFFCSILPLHRHAKRKEKSFKRTVAAPKRIGPILLYLRHIFGYYYTYYRRADFFDCIYYCRFLFYRSYRFGIFDCIRRNRQMHPCFTLYPIIHSISCNAAKKSKDSSSC